MNLPNTSPTFVHMPGHIETFTCNRNDKISEPYPQMCSKCAPRDLKGDTTTASSPLSRSLGRANRRTCVVPACSARRERMNSTKKALPNSKISASYGPRRVAQEHHKLQADTGCRLLTEGFAREWASLAVGVQLDMVFEARGAFLPKTASAHHPQHRGGARGARARRAANCSMQGGRAAVWAARCRRRTNCRLWWCASGHSKNLNDL